VIFEFARAHYAFSFPITIFFVVSVHAIHRSLKKKQRCFSNDGITHITRTPNFNIITFSGTVTLLKALLKFESTDTFFCVRFHNDAVKVPSGGASTLRHMRQCGGGSDVQQCQYLGVKFLAQKAIPLHRPYLMRTKNPPMVQNRSNQ
jgi:hypothetical protein